jgi:hypothetical protein
MPVIFASCLLAASYRVGRGDGAAGSTGALAGMELARMEAGAKPAGARARVGLVSAGLMFGVLREAGVRAPGLEQGLVSLILGGQPQPGLGEIVKAGTDFFLGG